MPELPEVETIRAGLSAVISGQKISNLQILSAKSLILHPKYYPQKALSAKILEKTAHDLLIDKKILNISRQGKALILELSGKICLIIHLRMTGQLIFVPKKSKNTFGRFAGGHPSENFLADLPNRQTRVVFTLETGTLFFNDQRKFGFIKILPADTLGNEPFLEKLAPEPWNYELKPWQEMLKVHSAPVKAVLLNQSNVAGLGNIYADEALFEAKIHPARPADSLSPAEAKRLLQAAGYVMQQAILAGGSTLATYLKPDGSRGNYLDAFARVYGRAGKPCVQCGTEITKIRLAGRGTHFCPQCQKLPRQSSRKNAHQPEHHQKPPALLRQKVERESKTPRKSLPRSNENTKPTLAHQPPKRSRSR